MAAPFVDTARITVKAELAEGMPLYLYNMPADGER